MYHTYSNGMIGTILIRLAYRTALKLRVSSRAPQVKPLKTLYEDALVTRRCIVCLRTPPESF